MAGARGRWSNRPSLSKIEQQATRLVSDFRHRLEQAGLTVPPIPPVPVEYLALTVTDLTLRGVTDLNADGKHLSAMLDPAREEICYEEKDSATRQAFSIAHELGHYFLHYLPLKAEAARPSLFSSEHFEPAEGEMPGYFRESQPETALETPRYYRCSESEIGAPEEAKTGKLSKSALSSPEEQARLLKIIRQKEWADRLEWEANSFASSLLMPADLVRWLDTKHAGDVKVISQELGVSLTAIRYRMNRLGLRQDENMGMFPKDKTKATEKTKSKKDTPNQGTFL